VGAASTSAQRGISLVFSLITLAALSLAAVALIRSVDTGSTILGNLSFKQDSALATEEASRQAIEWIFGQLKGTTLHADHAEGWYRASNMVLLDPTGNSSNTARAVIDWSNGNTCSAYADGTFTGGCVPSKAAYAKNGVVPGMSNGVTARYVIMRLCAAPGDPGTVTCARPLRDTKAAGTEHNALGNTETQFVEQPTQSQYFRVIVRAQGGRKTVTYTETLVHF
jgi:Tfp pilus assembly protein PilX